MARNNPHREEPAEQARKPTRSNSADPASRAGYSNRFGSPDRLADHVPFPIDDFESVNRLFVAYSDGESAEQLQTIEIWTYCFVRRYFVAKCLHDAQSSAADLEAMIEIAYKKIRGNRQKVNTGRYANWVSVVCRNSFLNYIRGRRTTVSLDDRGIADQLTDSGMGALSDGSAWAGTSRGVSSQGDVFRNSEDHSRPGGDRSTTGMMPADGELAIRRSAVRIVAEPDSMTDWDADRCRLAVAAAIARLPEYLQEVATLKILDGRSYPEIESRLNKPTPVLRAYVHRVLLRLRKDKTLLRFFSDG